MENQRLILFILLAMVGLLLWQAWETDRHRAAPAATSTAPAVAGATPAATQTVAPDLPPVPAPAAPADAAQAPAVAAPRVRVVTDLLEVDIDTQGGDVRAVNLMKYPVAQDQPQHKVRLLNDTLPQLFITQSGLLGRGATLPDHHATYQAAQIAYELAPGQQELQVPLTWAGPDGLTVTKVLTFHRDSYVIDVAYTVNNGTAQPVPVSLYRQLQRTEYAQENENGFVQTYTGGVVSNSSTKYEKVDFSDMDDWRAKESYSQGGWAAMLQHYFLAAWLAQPGEVNRFYTNVVEGSRYVIGLMAQEANVPAAGSLTLATRLYAGPKEQHRLAQAAPNLELTVDYGMLTVLAQPLYWLMEQIHKLVQNWGWSIIILTILIKLAFYKLTETQYKSMANMRRLQPKMEALKERYGDDRQKMGQAMMDMYKKEKINPLAGCLPIVVQIPVFIALYWVLVESVELRQADFALWIHDLTAKDPYFVLPLLMGVSMFIMQKLSPAPADPLQAKMMMALPFVFTVFFAFFPSGLVLYWLVNNLLSLAQQWYITRKIEAAAAS